MVLGEISSPIRGSARCTSRNTEMLKKCCWCMDCEAAEGDLWVQFRSCCTDHAVYRQQHCGWVENSNVKSFNPLFPVFRAQTMHADSRHCVESSHLIGGLGTHGGFDSPPKTFRCKRVQNITSHRVWIWLWSSCLFFAFLTWKSFCFSSYTH